MGLSTLIAFIDCISFSKMGFTALETTAEHFGHFSKQICKCEDGHRFYTKSRKKSCCMVFQKKRHILYMWQTVNTSFKHYVLLFLLNTALGRGNKSLDLYLYMNLCSTNMHTLYKKHNFQTSTVYFTSCISYAFISAARLHD